MSKHRVPSPTPLAAELRLEEFRATHHRDALSLEMGEGGNSTIDNIIAVDNMVLFVRAALAQEHFNYPSEAELTALLESIKGAWQVMLTIERSESKATSETWKFALDNIIESAIPVLETRDMLPKDISR